MQHKTKLNKIDIRITDAVITAIAFKFEKGNDFLPEVAVECDLVTQHGKIISSLSFSTNHWEEGRKIKKDYIPAHVFSAMGTALREMSSIVTRKINSIDNLLEAK